MTSIIILLKTLVLLVLWVIFVNVPKIEGIEPSCTIMQERWMCGDVCLENLGICHCGTENFTVSRDPYEVCCAKIGACIKSGQSKEEPFNFKSFQAFQPLDPLIAIYSLKCSTFYFRYWILYKWNCSKRWYIL